MRQVSALLAGGAISVTPAEYDSAPAVRLELPTPRVLLLPAEAVRLAVELIASAACAEQPGPDYWTDDVELVGTGGGE